MMGAEVAVPIALAIIVVLAAIWSRLGEILNELRAARTPGTTDIPPEGGQ
jgi:hypothetical protein